MPPEQQETEVELHEMADRVRSRFHLCRREGPELNGRSIEEVREMNAKWQRELHHVASADFDQMSGCLPEHLDRSNHGRRFRSARYGYFIYVDDEVLEEFRDVRAADNTVTSVTSDLAVMSVTSDSAVTSDTTASTTTSTTTTTVFPPTFQHNIAVRMAWTGYLDIDMNDPDEWSEDYLKTWQRIHVFRRPKFYHAATDGGSVWFDRFCWPTSLNAFSSDSDDDDL